MEQAVQIGGKRIINLYHYIDEDDLISLGWRIGKKPSRYAPNKMFTGGIFYNENGHLPSAPGRTWQEADINYVNGKRNIIMKLFMK